MSATTAAAGNLNLSCVAGVAGVAPLDIKSSATPATQLLYVAQRLQRSCPTYEPDLLLTNLLLSNLSSSSLA